MDINPIYLLIFIIISLIVIVITHYHLHKMIKENFSPKKSIPEKNDLTLLKEELENLKARVEKLGKETYKL